MAGKKIKRKPLVLGITGSFASGKTTVAKMFKELGVFVIDVDKIYHQLIKPKGPVYKRIVDSFGVAILKKNMEIDRIKLGKMVFGKKELLENLCKITHPAIIKKIEDELYNLNKMKNKNIIAIDAPLLIEAGMDKRVDKLIAVKIKRQLQFLRSKKKRGLHGAELIARIKSQIPLAKKIKLADYIIDNNGSLEQTLKQVKAILNDLKYY